MTRHPLADAAGGGGQRASECREASGDTDGVSDPFFLRLFSQHASHSSDVCGPLTTAKGEQKGWVPGCCGWPPRSPKTGGPVLESWSPRWRWAGCSSPPPKSTGSAGCGPSWYIEKGVKRSSTVVLYRSVSGGGRERGGQSFRSEFSLVWTRWAGSYHGPRLAAGGAGHLHGAMLAFQMRVCWTTLTSL